jgi:hypothetical protein
MISLKAPKITAAERKQILAAKNALENKVKAIEGSSKRISDFRKKEKTLRAEAEDLHRAAANFDKESEIKLVVALKQLERVAEAIQSENNPDEGLDIFTAIDEAQEIVGQICQKTYEELLDLQADSTAKFYLNRHEARHVAKTTSHAARDLTNKLLRHGAVQFDSDDRVFQVAQETLAKLNALLNGTEIWRYDGGESALEPSAA